MTDEALDKLVLLLVSGLQPTAVQEAAAKLGLPEAEIPAAIAEARTRIAIAARYNRHEQLGAAMVRLNDLYRRALAIQDTKTALAAQKELNKLLELYHPPVDAGRTDELDGEIATARRHLAPLGLADDRTPLAELCRLAVLKVLEAS